MYTTIKLQYKTPVWLSLQIFSAVEKYTFYIEKFALQPNWSFISVAILVG